MLPRFLAALACVSFMLGQQPPVEAAWGLLARGERTQAISTLRTLLRTHPADADARLLLGSILAEDGDRTESIEQLTEAVRLRPKSAEAHNALGGRTTALTTRRPPERPSRRRWPAIRSLGRRTKASD